MPKRPPSFKAPWARRDTAAIEKARRAALDKQRGTRQERGYGADWQAFRREHLKLNPLCVECGSDDRPNVDHIESVREAPHRRLDPSNVRTLCHSCHSRRTAKDQGFGRSRGKKVTVGAGSTRGE